MIQRSPDLTVGEFSLLTRTSRHAVIDWIKRGDIDAYVLPGPRYLIPRSELSKIALPPDKSDAAADLDGVAGDIFGVKLGTRR